MNHWKACTKSKIWWLHRFFHRRYNEIRECAEQKLINKTGKESHGLHKGWSNEEKMNRFE